VAGVHRDSQGHGEVRDRLGSGYVPHLAVRAAPGSLGHDRAQRGDFRGRLQQHLAADREPDAAYAVGVHVLARPQVLDRGLHVAVAIPSVGVRVTLALALAAAIEQQHAVAVPGEEARAALRTLAARERDDGRAVARRDVPALELEPVARLEADLLVRAAQPRLGHLPTPEMRELVPHHDRHHDEEAQGRGPHGDERPASAPAGQTALDAAAAPQRDRREREQRSARRNAHHAGEVVTGRTDRQRVVPALEPHGDSERADQQRRDAAGERTKPRVRDRRADE
jgi:hypothetical protein